jgi:hypothetical protein
MLRSRARQAFKSLEGQQAVTLSLLQHFGLSPRAEVQVQERVVVAYARPDARSIREALEPMLTATLLATYQFEGERVRLVSHLAGLLSVASTTAHMHDITSLRRAAFAGWAVFTTPPLTSSVDVLNSWLQD